MSLSTDLRAKALAALSKYGLNANIAASMTTLDKTTGRPSTNSGATVSTKALIGPLEYTYEEGRRVVRAEMALMDRPSVNSVITYAGASYKVLSYTEVKPTDTSIIFTAKVEAL